MSAVCCLYPPRRGARREFEVHVTELLSAQPDAAGWAGTVGMGVNGRKLVAVDTQSLRADNRRQENAR
ncbi:MAG: hypothetical protein HY323_03175 [Betaproteobacteria bacterium]|nr:hypothetical protein [Betaproteobacteria bacterium]